MSQETSFVPKPRTTSDMMRRVQEAASVARSEAQRKAYALPTGSAWVLHCGIPSHIGILFLDGVDPRRDKVIHGGMWMASYHDPDDIFLGGRGQIVCDTCLHEIGDPTKVLKVELVKGPPGLGACFTVPARWQGRFLRVATASELAALAPAKEEPPPPPKAEVPPEPPVPAEPKAASAKEARK